jgi:hypothetical protein
MWQMHRYLFYRFYRLMKTWWWWVDDDPWVQALCAYSAVMFSNLFIVWIVAEEFFGVAEIGDHMMTVFTFLILAVNYTTLIPKGGVRRILNEFSSETEASYRTRGIAFYAYVVTSFLSLWIVPFAFKLLRNR